MTCAGHRKPGREADPESGSAEHRAGSTEAIWQALKGEVQRSVVYRATSSAGTSGCQRLLIVHGMQGQGKFTAACNATARLKVGISKAAEMCIALDGELDSRPAWGFPGVFTHR